MPPFLLALLVILYCASFKSYAQDPLQIEVQLRESPVKLQAKLLSTLPTPFWFENEAEFKKIAAKAEMSLVSLKQRLQLLSRLSLINLARKKNRFEQAEKYIQLNKLLIDSDYDESYHLMLQGRLSGRKRQDFKAAIEFYNQAIDKIFASQSLRDLTLKYTLHNDIGNLYLLTRQNHRAHEHFTQSLHIAEKLNNDYLFSAAKITLGKYHHKLGEPAKALSYYIDASKASEPLKYAAQHAYLQLHLARVYRDLNIWDEALAYAHDAVNDFQSLGNLAQTSASMTVIAMIYSKQERWYKAIDYHLNALQIDLKRANVMAQARHFHNLGEAYAKINDTKTSLKFLVKANDIFSQKNSQQYLVYNDLLIASVYATNKQWRQSLQYATLALNIATDMKLIPEQIEAITLQLSAYKQLNMQAEYQQSQTKLLSLQAPTSETDLHEVERAKAKLAQQKLKQQLQRQQLEINNKNHDLSVMQNLIYLTAVAVVLSMYICIRLWQDKLALTKKIDTINAQSRLDPITQLPGYLSFTHALSAPQSNALQSIGLISIPEQHNADILLGISENNRQSKQMLNQIEVDLNCQAYLLRPGLIIICLKQVLQGDELLTKIKTAYVKSTTVSLQKARLAVGILELPLIADTTISLEADLHFYLSQIMLSQALKLGSDKDYYVSMKTQDFISAAIFTEPLTDSVAVSINRGLIKLSSNGSLDQVSWA